MRIPGFESQIRRPYGSRATPRDFLPRRQAALEAGISDRAMQALIASGGLPGARKVRTGRAGEMWVVPSEAVAVLAVRQAAGLTGTARRDAALARGRVKSIETRRRKAQAGRDGADLLQVASRVLEAGGAPAVAAALERARLPASLPISQIPPTWRAAARSAFVSQLNRH
jgi:hypothetical protein